MLAASSAVKAPTQAIEHEHVGRQTEEREGASHEEHAGGHHGGGVDERGHRRRAFHRVGQPDVQRELRRLAHRAEVDQEHDAAAGASTGSVPIVPIGNSVQKSKVPVADHSMTMPATKPRSPSLVIQNAFTAARAAAGRSYQ